MSSAFAIQMEKVGKSYEGRHVLRGLDFSVERGKTVFIFGENGSGKTSLLKIVCALTKPTSGKASICGFDTACAASRVREKVGFVSHEDCLYEDLSVFDNLCFFCRLQGVEKPADRAGELIESFEIPSSRIPAGLLSAGMKKRASIARAVSHNPEVLVMDEPFSSLDGRGRAILSEFVENLKTAGKTALISTHLITEGIELSDLAALLKNGHISFCEKASGALGERIVAEMSV